jgi:hypothetical protein
MRREDSLSVMQIEQSKAMLLKKSQALGLALSYNDYSQYITMCLADKTGKRSLLTAQRQGCSVEPVL